MTKLVVAFLFLTSFSLFAQEAGVTFIDPETRSASDVDVGDGLNAILTLPLQLDSSRLDVELLVFPEFKLDEAPLYQRNFKKERSEFRGLWRKTFKLPSFKDKNELIARFGRVARLRLSWKNESNGESGVLVRKFYLLESKTQKFFKILDPGDLRAPQHSDRSSVCSYRKGLQIVGTYIQNPSLSPQEYEFNQNVAFDALGYRGPLNAMTLDTLGLVDKKTPIFQSDGGALGWLMTGWTHFEGTETKLSFKPKIVLQAGQGGFFIKETLMKRFRAQLFSFQHKGIGASEWLAGAEGFLDIGSTLFDFVTITYEDSQDPAMLERLLSERSEMMTTCSRYPEERDRVYHTAPTNTLHEETFFTTAE